MNCPRLIHIGWWDKGACYNCPCLTEDFRPGTHDGYCKSIKTPLNIIIYLSVNSVHGAHTMLNRYRSDQWAPSFDRVSQTIALTAVHVIHGLGHRWSSIFVYKFPFTTSKHELSGRCLDCKPFMLQPSGSESHRCSRPPP